MLPKTNCLKKKKDFERVFKKGKGFKEDFLVIRFVPNNQKKSRFGIIISKKISKKATIRNKIKRRIRQLLRIRLKEIRKGIDIVLIGVPGLENKDFWEIEEVLTNLLKKAKLI
jgi:ribonuclease P protein component